MSIVSADIRIEDQDGEKQGGGVWKKAFLPTNPTLPEPFK